MDYKKYKAVDFATDEFFQRWVMDSDPETDKFWGEWTRQFPERQLELEEGRRLLQLVRFENTPKAKVEVAKSRIWLKLDQEINTNNKRGTGLAKNIVMSNQFWYSIAASLLVLLGFFIWNGHQTDAPETITEMPFIEKYAPKGQRSTISLTDGTVVKLNSESRIKIPGDFGVSSRDIYLEGEAYFKVSKDLRPFRVITQGISTTALGTSFNIQAYPTYNSIQIALETGEVAVSTMSTDRGTYFLKPNQMVVFDKGTDESSLKKFDPAKVMAWTNGKIFFEKTSFEDVVKTLERWYGVEFIIENPNPRTNIYSGEYENQSLETVLKGIGFSLGFQFSIQDKTVYVNFKT